MSCMSAYSMPLCTIFTKCPAPSWPMCVHARLALGDRRDRLQDRAQGDPRLVRAAGHDRGAEQGALLAAGDAGADEVDAGLAHRLLAADGVGEQGVAAVDDDVARLEHLHERVDDGVGGAAGLDHDDRGAGLLQRRRELLVGGRRDELRLGVLGEQRLGLRVAAVVHRHRVAFTAGEVAGQIRAHHRQSDDTDVRCRLRHTHSLISDGARLPA